MPKLRRLFPQLVRRLDEKGDLIHGANFWPFWFLFKQNERREYSSIDEVEDFFESRLRAQRKEWERKTDDPAHQLGARKTVELEQGAKGRELLERLRSGEALEDLEGEIDEYLAVRRDLMGPSGTEEG